MRRSAREARSTTDGYRRRQHTHVRCSPTRTHTKKHAAARAPPTASPPGRSRTRRCGSRWRRRGRRTGSSVCRPTRALLTRIWPPLAYAGYRVGGGAREGHGRAGPHMCRCVSRETGGSALAAACHGPADADRLRYRRDSHAATDAPRDHPVSEGRRVRAVGHAPAAQAYRHGGAGSPHAGVADLQQLAPHRRQRHRARPRFQKGMRACGRPPTPVAARRCQAHWREGVRAGRGATVRNGRT